MIRSRTTQLVVLLVTAFALPWSVWGSAIAQQHGLLSFRLPQGVALWTLLPATVLVAALSGRGALRELGRQLLRFRTSPRWYAVALLLPVGIAAMALLTGAVLRTPVALGQTMPLVPALIYLGYGTGLFLLTEELAWRGFALPRLLERFGPGVASILLGVVWALWHLPMFFVPTSGLAGQSYPAFALFAIATTALLTWLYRVTGASLPVLALCHAACDATYSYTGIVGDNHLLMWSAAGFTAALAAIVLTVERARGRATAPQPVPARTA
jgi:membrane protease YdiL (CAAX protease family)